MSIKWTFSIWPLRSLSLCGKKARVPNWRWVKVGWQSCDWCLHLMCRGESESQGILCKWAMVHLQSCNPESPRTDLPRRSWLPAAFQSNPFQNGEQLATILYSWSIFLPLPWITVPLIFTPVYHDWVPCFVSQFPMAGFLTVKSQSPCFGSLILKGRLPQYPMSVGMDLFFLGLPW